MSSDIFVSDLNLGKLPSLEAEALGDSISLKELWDTIQEKNLDKSMGPDGIPIKVYIKFWP